MAVPAKNRQRRGSADFRRGKRRKTIARTSDKYFWPGVASRQHLHAAVVFVLVKQGDTSCYCALIRNGLPVAVVCTYARVALVPTMIATHAKEHMFNMQVGKVAGTAWGTIVRLRLTLVKRDRSIIGPLPACRPNYFVRLRSYLTGRRLVKKLVVP